MPLKLPSISRKTLSMDFGSKEIKVIEGKYTKDNVQILKAFTISVEPHFYLNGEILNKDVLATSIKNKLKENKISTTITYGIINSSKVITREIIIPKVSLKELKSVVSYQIADYLPINIDDYVVKYLNLGNIHEGDMEKIKILLLAIPNNIVLSHLELLKDSGLKPEILDYQGNAIAKLLNYNDLVNSDYNTRDLVIASVDIGYSNAKLTIIKNGKIEVTRVIDTGGKAMYDNIFSFFDYSIEDVEEKLVEIKSLNNFQDEFSDNYRLSNIVRTSLIDLCEKIEVVFRYYNTRETGNMINYILLQGGFSNIKEIDNLFSTYFNIPTMQLSTLDKINWSENLSKYANAIGGLIRIDEV